MSSATRRSDLIVVGLLVVVSVALALLQFIHRDYVGLFTVIRLLILWLIVFMLRGRPKWLFWPGMVVLLLIIEYGIRVGPILSYTSEYNVFGLLNYLEPKNHYIQYLFDPGYLLLYIALTVFLLARHFWRRRRSAIS